MSKKETKNEAPKNNDFNYKKYRYLESPLKGLGEVTYLLSRMNKKVRDIYPSPNNKDCYIIVIDK